MAPSRIPNLRQFLDRLSLRSVLNEEEEQAILNLPCSATQVPAHRDFVHINERRDHICFVAAGMVGRFDQNCDGKRQIIAFHIPGDMCDLHSVFQPVSSSGLQTLAASTILSIPHAAIRNATKTYPAVAEALWRDCMVDAAILAQWVTNVGRRNARQRVAHLLCELATRFGATKKPEEIMFVLPLTQEHLAEATALTSVHVNRTIQGLRRDGLVNWRGQVVHLPMWDKLAGMAEFEPDYLQTDIAPEQQLRIVEG